jgi:hypothetical protein
MNVWRINTKTKELEINEIPASWKKPVVGV